LEQWIYYHYFYIRNINRYDVIIGTAFMKQHGICWILRKTSKDERKKPLALCESVDKYLQSVAQASDATVKHCK